MTEEHRAGGTMAVPRPGRHGRAGIALARSFSSSLDAVLKPFHPQASCDVSEVFRWARAHNFSIFQP